MISSLRRAPLGRIMASAAFAMVAALAPMTVAAQESTNRVNAMTDWNVFVENSPKECWGVSAPKKTENTLNGKPAEVRRGEILLFVTHRPGKKAEITFTGGYPFAKGSTVNVNVDGKTFELFTDGEWAWPGTADDDAKLLAAMKAGTNAVLTARSGRGTQTQDTFSLRGFTAAVNDAAARCK